MNWRMTAATGVLLFMQGTLFTLLIQHHSYFIAAINLITAIGLIVSGARLSHSARMLVDSQKRLVETLKQTNEFYRERTGRHSDWGPDDFRAPGI